MGLGSIDIYAAARSVLVVGRIGEFTRAVVQDKSNLAPMGKSLSFELDPILGFKWHGECNATVDDVMRGKPQKENQFSKARRIIQSELSGGYAVASRIIIEAAETENVSYKTLNRAKLELGVITTKRADGWYWQLPIDVNFTESTNQNQSQNQDRQVGQSFALTTLSNFKSETEIVL